MSAGSPRIRRSAHNPTNPYVMIRRDAAADSRLSWKARGLLAYLLSLPDGWDIAVRDLVQRGPDGRDAVYTALQELKTYGYLTEEIERHPTRKHIVNRYYVLWEAPPTPAQELDPENPDQGPSTTSELDPENPDQGPDTTPELDPENPDQAPRRPELDPDFLDRENPDQARPLFLDLESLDPDPDPERDLTRDLDLKKDLDPERDPDPERSKELNTHRCVWGDRLPDPAGSRSAVSARLVAAGVAAPVAQRLVAVHGPARCAAVLTWLDQARGSHRPRHPAGWIRRALEEHWPAPPWASPVPPAPARLLTVLCPTCGNEFAAKGSSASRVPCPHCAAAVALAAP